jgi:hypothetical protein
MTALVDFGNLSLLCDLGLWALHLLPADSNHGHPCNSSTAQDKLPELALPEPCAWT